MESKVSLQPSQLPATGPSPELPEFFNTPTSFVINNQFNTVQPGYSGTETNLIFFGCWQALFVRDTWSLNPLNTGSSELQIFPLKTGFRYVQVQCKTGFALLSFRLILVVPDDLSLSGLPIKILKLFFISPVCAVTLSVSPYFAWMCQKCAAFLSLLSRSVGFNVDWLFFAIKHTVTPARQVTVSYCSY